MFLSILAILLVPFGKGYWWSLLIGTTLIKIVRYWREAWEYFSLDTISRVISAVLGIPVLLLLYFLFSFTSPSLIHGPPSFESLIGTYPLRSDRPLAGIEAYSLEISEDGDDFRVRLFLSDDVELRALEAKLRRKALNRAAAIGLPLLVPVETRYSRLPLPALDRGRENARLEIDASGAPRRLRISRGGHTLFEGRVDGS
ncbi:MAG: hypothetical protein ACE5F1_10875 [Planctomycetota bacterium]